MPSMTFTISDLAYQRMLTAFTYNEPRNPGETDAQYVRRIIIQTISGKVLSTEGDIARNQDRLIVDIQ